MPAERAATEPGTGRGRLAVALAVMVASGFAGLGYQLVWTQQSALWLGHEAAAVLAVLTAFFGGLALGAWALGSRIRRSARPERWYAGCELVIAAWNLVLAWLMAPLSSQLLAWTGAEPGAAWQWAVALVGSFACLLPATAAMGATLPAMERVTARLHPAGRAIPALYAANTLGALAGVLVVAFWWLPGFGLAQTAALCGGLNLLCAAGALALAGGPLPAALDAGGGSGKRLLWLLAATGLLGIGYEVLVVRVLSQVCEDTVYTFALLLAMYLGGTAAGAAAYQRWGLAWQPGAAPAALQDRLLRLVALACLLGTTGLWFADDVRQAVQPALQGRVLDAMAAALAAEAVLAGLAFILPTLAMGALFSHLAARSRGAGLGAALAANTLGAAAAPPLLGVLLVPALGAKASLLALVVGYLALTLPRIKAATLALGGAAAALAVWAPPLAFVDVPEGGRILSYREGTLAAVSVVEDAAGVARLRINNRQQEGSSGTRLTDARQGLLPVLLHPGPQRVLFLGLGTGVTASAAAADPSLQVDAAELLPEVIAASAHFVAADVPQRLRVVAADARRFVRAAGPRYDVIVADNFHPARSGSGSLYTVEHFQAVRQRLAPGGLFCQWLPLHQLDLATLRSIVASFMQVYPGAWAMLATNSLETPVLGLVARDDGRHFDLAQTGRRLASHTLPQDLADYGIADPWALLGGFVAGPHALARLADGAPVNTDDLPVVAYRAPRLIYANDSLPRDRLLELLAGFSLGAAELVDTPATAADLRRLQAYWRARDGFIAAGRHVRPAGDARQMLAQVREPLLAALRTSPDFRPAYDPLLRLAAALARSDEAAARALLHELVRVQPQRGEAEKLLIQLFGAAR
ncbi:fused MFS/spermidine synthase [Rubrivivax sp. A210]|uniref:fused MFS/spermidine synthase n=1 Tax=Rubrivivax sp. A210 TaxID=2772301 RepID=UPI001F1E4CEF|nr:fused MFS/spermidine synthase [Rubrivivax sp. A210]